MSLGHGLADNAAVRHAFLGTAAVVHALAALPGYEAGAVRVSRWVRDEATHRIVGLEA